MLGIGALRTICIAAMVPLAWGIATQRADSTYAPLLRYQGIWHMGNAGGVSEELVNRCNRIGRYFACEQTVDGKLEGLVVYIPAKVSGHYYTQAITAEGRASGRSELTIDGETWIYSGTGEKDEQGFSHRTVNIFNGEDRIHYEQQRSSDDKTWTTTSSGDEVRVSKTASAPRKRQ